jgi:ketosteroid isomerase-like protein
LAPLGSKDVVTNANALAQTLWNDGRALALFKRAISTVDTATAGNWRFEFMRNQSAEAPAVRRKAAVAGEQHTCRAMTDESTTPDLVELVRESVDAGDRADLDALLALYAPDAMWDMSNVGMGEFKGLAAIRGFLEDWFGLYEEMRWEAEEIRDLGNGVTLAVVVQTARPLGSTGEVQVRSAAVTIWANRLAERVANYSDIDEARADAERLARERG